MNEKLEIWIKDRIIKINCNIIGTYNPESSICFSSASILNLFSDTLE